MPLLVNFDCSLQQYACITWALDNININMYICECELDGHPSKHLE